MATVLYSWHTVVPEATENSLQAQHSAELTRLSMAVLSAAWHWPLAGSAGSAVRPCLLVLVFSSPAFATAVLGFYPLEECCTFWMQRQEHLVPSETNKGDFSLRVVYLDSTSLECKGINGPWLSQWIPKAGEKTLEKQFFLLHWSSLLNSAHSCSCRGGQLRWELIVRSSHAVGIVKVIFSCSDKSNPPYFSSACRKTGIKQLAFGRHVCNGGVVVSL